MTRSIVLLWLTTATVGFTGVRQACGEDIQAVEKKIARQWAKIRSLSATVSMEKHFSQTSASAGSSTQGKLLYLNKDDKEMFRQDLENTQPSMTGSTTEARKITIIGDGEFVYLLSENDGLYKASKNKQKGSNISCGGKTMLDYLERNFVLKLLPDETVDDAEAYVIEATPIGRMRRRKIRYYISKEIGCLLQRISLSGKGERNTVLTYSDIQTNIKISPEQFIFTPPKGVPVKDQTTPG